MMKKRMLAIFSALMLFGSIALSTGCSKEPADSSSAGSSSGSTTTASSKADSGVTTTESSSDSTSATEGAGENTTATTEGSAVTNPTTPPQNDGPTPGNGQVTNIKNADSADPYHLKMELPAVKVPTSADVRGDLFVSKDKNWWIDSGITIGDTILVNSKEGSVAMNLQQHLGNTWTVGASFRPIKRWSTSADPEPICSRIWINDKYGKEVFMVTVNYIPESQQVLIAFQMNSNGSWRTFKETDWMGTESTRFYMEVSCPGYSDDSGTKISCKVVGDKGELLSATSPIKVKKSVLDNVTAAGFGVYASATEYYYWNIEGNGPATFTYPEANP